MSEHSEQPGEREGLLPIERRTYLLTLAAGASATGGAAGGAAAASSQSQEDEVSQTRQHFEDSWVGYGNGEYGKGLYGDVGPPSLPGIDAQPTDIDGDGLFENVDGSEEFSIVDVQTFFDNMNSETVQRYPEFFDYNEDEEIDIFDVQALFNRLKEAN